MSHSGEHAISDSTPLKNVEEQCHDGCKDRQSRQNDPSRDRRTNRLGWSHRRRRYRDDAAAKIPVRCPPLGSSPPKAHASQTNAPHP